MLPVDVLERDDARDPSAGDERHVEHGLRHLAGEHGLPYRSAASSTSSLIRSGSRVSITCSPEADQLDRLLGDAHAALDRVREVQQPGRLVVDRDVDDLRVEDVADLVADDVVDRLQLELAGERLLDAVDQRELGVALPRLLDRPRARERRADVLADEREQLLVLLAVAGRPSCTTARRGRRPSARSALSGTPSQLESSVTAPTSSISPCSISSCCRSYEISCGSPVRSTYAGHPARLTAAELDPLVRVGPVVVELVDPVGVVDQLPLLVVERDVEVVRVHQLADDGVHRPVELLQVLRRARELGDAVQRGLHLLRVTALGLGRLELGQPPPRLGELRGAAGVRCQSSSNRATKQVSSATGRPSSGQTSGDPFGPAVLCSADSLGGCAAGHRRAVLLACDADPDGASRGRKPLRVKAGVDRRGHGVRRWVDPFRQFRRSGR